VHEQHGKNRLLFGGEKEMRKNCVCGFDFKEDKARASAHLFVCKEGMKEAIRIYKENNPLPIKEVKKKNGLD
jgi:hypothetical protein